MIKCVYANETLRIPFVNYKNIKYLTVKFEQKSLDLDEKRNLGIVKGYASTFGNIDRGDDLIDEGAFDKTIARHKEKKRPVRMLWQHHTTELIGGYPAESLAVDPKGLFVVGEINLETQRGKEAYALAKQGVLTDFSIGFNINESEDTTIDNKVIRVIKELELFEVSLVGEPMNTEANITEVKAVVSFQNLPTIDKETVWDSPTATNRTKEFTGSCEAPSVSYKNAFLWHDKDNQNKFDAYKLLIADIVDGKLTVIPKALFAAAAAVASGDAGIPDGDLQGVINNINRYYEKMGLESPLKIAQDKDSKVVDAHKAETIRTKREFERLLRDTGFFTRKAAFCLAARFIEDNQGDPDLSQKKQRDSAGYKDILSELNKLTAVLH